ncbi:MAG: hypothetical protein J0L84_09750, partial [Verrucomicrobia bacterium]|nr:hypothetical protein [Verrucomicrobiota bacterium]
MISRTSRNAWHHVLNGVLPVLMLTGSGLKATPDTLPTSGRLTRILDGPIPALGSRSVNPVVAPFTVPFRARVVTGDGSQATNYSLHVGSAVHPAPALPGGGNQGYHLVVLTRSTLSLISSASFPATLSGLSDLGIALQSATSSELVVLYSMGPTVVSMSIEQASFTAGAIQQVGGAGSAFFDVGSLTTAGAYLLIGNNGLSTATALELSSLVVPETTGSVEASFVQDIPGNYFPAFRSFVTVRTSALLAGAQGGFHLVVARRDALDQVSTNASVVLHNGSYATASSQADSETDRLLADLNALAGPIGSGQALVILAGLHAPPAPAGSNTFQVIGLLNELGGVGDLLNLTPAGYYSFIGHAEPSGATPRPAENRSWALPAGAAGTVNLTSVMHPDRQGLFTSLASDTVGGVDYRLYEVALSKPSAWPVAPDAGDGPCTPEDEQCIGYQWISAYITADPRIVSIRDTYILADSQQTLGIYYTRLDELTYDQVPSGLFSKHTFDTLKPQLLTELEAAAQVQGLYTDYNSLVSEAFAAQTGTLISTYAVIESSIAPPPSAGASYETDIVLRTLAMAAVTMDPDPVSRAALGVVSAGMFLGDSLNRTPAGASTSVILATEGELASAIVQQFTNNAQGIAMIFTDILSNWDKLQLVGTLAQGPAAPGNGFAWLDGTQARVVAGLVPTFQRSYARALLPLVYQYVVFQGVPFSRPQDYNYQGECGPKSCLCIRDLYDPPSFTYRASDGPPNYFITMLATPDKRYPNAELMQTQLPGMGVYLPDLFNRTGMWSGVFKSV